MANTKTKKPIASEKVDELVQSESETVADFEEVMQDSVEETLNAINESVDSVAPQVPAQKEVRISDDIPQLDEMIACKSMVFGGLIWVSDKTNSSYRWGDIGEIEYISFGELIALNNSKKAFLTKPYIILLDPRAVKYFRLVKVYESVAKINNLTELFQQPMSKIDDTISVALAANMRDILISKVRDMLKTGALTNINIIKMLEKRLKHDLSDIEIDVDENK